MAGEQYMLGDEWIFHDEIAGAGLTIEEVGLLNIVRGLTDPSGFCERLRSLDLMYPDSKALLDRLEEKIQQRKCKITVRILSPGVWWFPCRWFEKLGKSFNPENNKQMNTFRELLSADIHPSEVPHVYWGGLEKFPLERLKDMYSEEMVDVVQKRGRYAFSWVNKQKAL